MGSDREPTTKFNRGALVGVVTMLVCGVLGFTHYFSSPAFEVFWLLLASLTVGLSASFFAYGFWSTARAVDPRRVTRNVLLTGLLTFLVSTLIGYFVYKAIEG
ncbi:hypothetical protein SAMN04488565_2187 [Leucobacter chromiiresistens]|uniref:Uncharacterized protein n=1 Tax=Leucobacter chromiiresistens TaxID=1079994 RepID=A0A1H0ZZV7_9MICO|nr:hypothetical protein SAMN04488565_2187 [Leucobacter chromiiresistens]